MHYNLLVKDTDHLIMTAWSGNKLCIYILKEHQYTIFDSILFNRKQYQHVPFEALLDIYARSGYTHKDNQSYAFQSIVLNLKALRKWNFGTIYGIVCCTNNKFFDASTDIQIVDLSAYMRLYQTKNIYDAYCMWREEQLSTSSYLLCGILIVTSTKRTINDNIYIELINKKSRELSLRPGKVYTDHIKLLQDIFESVVACISMENSTQISGLEEVMTKNDQNPWCSLPYQVNSPSIFAIHLADSVDKQLTGNVDYETENCQGFGCLKISEGFGTIAVQLPNYRFTMFSMLTQVHTITVKWLISKEYMLE